MAGVVEVGRGLGLPAEALDEGGVGGELGEQHLDRHGPVEHLVARQEDLGHAAPGDPSVQLVATVEHDGFTIGHDAPVTLVNSRAAPSRPCARRAPTRRTPAARSAAALHDRAGGVEQLAGDGHRHLARRSARRRWAPPRPSRRTPAPAAAVGAGEADHPGVGAAAVGGDLGGARSWPPTVQPGDRQALWPCPAATTLTIAARIVSAAGAGLTRAAPGPGRHACRGPRPRGRARRPPRAGSAPGRRWPRPAATSAICSGVACTSFWPIDAWASAAEFS